MCATMNELEVVVNEYRSMKALLQETEEIVKGLEREIYSYMDTNNKLDEVGADFKIKISECVRKTLDQKRLENDLGSLAAYMRETNYRRLAVR